MGGICAKVEQSNNKESKILVALEDFLQRCYENTDRLDGLHSILLNSRAKVFFVDYIYSQWDEFVASLNSKIAVTDFTRETLPYMLEAVLFGSKGISSLQLALKNEVIIRFPDFIKSGYYKRWRSVENNNATVRYNSSRHVSTTIPDILDTQEFAVASSKLKTAKACIPPALISAMPSVETMSATAAKADGLPSATLLPESGIDDGDEDFTADVMAAIDYLEMEQIMKYDMDLFLMLCTMENAPVSFTLATASTQRLGFPLIYANRHFEKLTGYRRSEVIGKSAKFLQTDINDERMCEDVASDRLATCLRNGRPCQQKITNFRRNGERYMSYVILNPIYDSYGTFIYVASIQFEITDIMSFMVASKLAELFIGTMPDGIFPCPSEDFE